MKSFTYLFLATVLGLSLHGEELPGVSAGGLQGKQRFSNVWANEPSLDEALQAARRKRGAKTPPANVVPGQTKKVPTPGFVKESVTSPKTARPIVRADMWADEPSFDETLNAARRKRGMKDLPADKVPSQSFVKVKESAIVPNLTKPVKLNEDDVPPPPKLEKVESSPVKELVAKQSPKVEKRETLSRPGKSSKMLAGLVAAPVPSSPPAVVKPQFSAMPRTVSSKGRGRDARVEPIVVADSTSQRGNSSAGAPIQPVQPIDSGVAVIVVDDEVDALPVQPVIPINSGRLPTANVGRGEPHWLNTRDETAVATRRSNTWASSSPVSTLVSTLDVGDRRQESISDSSLDPYSNHPGSTYVTTLAGSTMGAGSELYSSYQGNTAHNSNTLQTSAMTPFEKISEYDLGLEDYEWETGGGGGGPASGLVEVF